MRLKKYSSVQKFKIGKKIQKICKIKKVKFIVNDDPWLTRKLKIAEIGNDLDVSKMTKIVAGKKLWNYDALEPTEKKGAI